jgi:hypothetical protein
MMQLLQLTALLVFGSLTLTAFFVVLVALFPRRLARTRAVAEAMPGRSMLVGAINLIFFSAVVIALVALNQWTGARLFVLPALAVLAVLLVAATFGLGGVVQLVGERLLPQSSGMRRTVLGTLTLGWACALPFLGWFGLLPLVVAFGLGAFILSLFSQTGHAVPAV